MIKLILILVLILILGVGAVLTFSLLTPKPKPQNQPFLVQNPQISAASPQSTAPSPLAAFLEQEKERIRQKIQNTPDKPWVADLYIARGDGESFGNYSIFQKQAGVPSSVKDSKGRLISVFQWFPTDEENLLSFDKVAVKISEDDGKTWSDAESIKISGMPSDLQPPYDPTITLDNSGKLRLFFTTHKLGMNQPMYYDYATSDNGVNYTYQGTAFKDNDNWVVDSSVVNAGNTWYMIAPIMKKQGLALDAVSSDGKTFTKSSSNRESKAAWVGNLIKFGDSIRFYGSDPTSIWYSQTSDGKNWTPPKSINVEGGDPSIVAANDGSYYLIYVSPKTDIPSPKPSSQH